MREVRQTRGDAEISGGVEKDCEEKVILRSWRKIRVARRVVSVLLGLSMFFNWTHQSWPTNMAGIAGSVIGTLIGLGLVTWLWR
jgi:hypothetical protein